MSTSRQMLRSEGFQHVSTRPVALPHHVWKAEIDVEFDRRLLVVEKALLDLVGAGVGDSALLQRLLGLVGEPIVPRHLAELMREGFIASVEDRLVLTKLGQQELKVDRARESKTCSVHFRHDPYRDEVLWEFGDDVLEVKAQDLELAGLAALPMPQGLSAAQLQMRLPELQKIVERDGLPWDDKKERKGEKSRPPEILRVKPDKFYIAYRRAELEIWHSEASDDVRWILLLAGGEFLEASAKFREMEADGQVIVPHEDRERFMPGPKEEAIQVAIQEINQIAPPALLETSDHRPALEQAIQDAAHSLIIISPWIRTAAVDQEMLDWFRHGLERNKDLQIHIGYGIEDEGMADRRGEKTRKAREQEAAISRLQRVSQEFHGRLRLVNIGNTHEKIVIVDERYAIITSFNFLSFNPRPGRAIGPGRGIRRETGYRLSESLQVKALRERLIGILIEARPTAGQRRPVKK